jgi:hypothetical protein
MRALRPSALPAPEAPCLALLRLHRRKPPPTRQRRLPLQPAAFRPGNARMDTGPRRRPPLRLRMGLCRPTPSSSRPTPSLRSRGRPTIPASATKTKRRIHAASACSKGCQRASWNRRSGTIIASSDCGRPVNYASSRPEGHGRALRRSKCASHRGQPAKCRQGHAQMCPRGYRNGSTPLSP